MITGVFISGLFAVIYAITAPLRALPDVSATGGISGPIATASGWLASINFFFPSTELVSWLSAVLVIAYAVIFYEVLMWGLRKIPGVG